MSNAARLWNYFGTLWKVCTGYARNVVTGRLPNTGVQLGISIPFSQTGFSSPMNEGTQEMTLNRMVFTDKSTIGELWIDGKFFCFVLEPSCRDKTSLHPAIPAKRYLVNIQYSNKFGRKMPHLVDVPDRDNILIHWGNFPTDTEGCLILGDNKGVDYVGNSRATFEKFWPLVLERTDNKMLFLTILGGRVAHV